ncbi:MAG: VWA domain-containing protein [Haloferacaceae archaeon]
MSDDVPDFAGARDHVIETLVWFARRLRREGARLPANAALSGARALATVGLDDRDRVRAALRASLVADEHDAERFDEAFPTFWYRLRSGLEASVATDDGGPDRRPDEEDDAGGLAGPTVEVDDAPDPAEGTATTERRQHVRSAPGETADEREAETEQVGGYSAVGEGESVDDDAAGAADPATVRRFARAVARLPDRRWRRGDGPRVDARRALRRSLSAGGTMLSVPRRERSPTAFRLCLLVDVSRSVLDTVDRGFLLSVLDRLVTEGRGTRAFLFDTDIREATGAFAGARGDPAAALADAELRWGGGTRIGDALTALRDRHPDAVGRRTVAVVVSDGLDVGEPEPLEEGMVWLSRRAAATLWLNPLAGTEGYEPTCRGMATALPYVDGLFAFAGDDDLAEVARQLERRGFGGPLGYRHDPRLEAT